MIYYDILWYIMIYYDILWYIMIYYVLNVVHFLDLRMGEFNPHEFRIYRSDLTEPSPWLCLSWAKDASHVADKNCFFWPQKPAHRKQHEWWLIATMLGKRIQTLQEELRCLSGKRHDFCKKRVDTHCISSKCGHAEDRTVEYDWNRPSSRCEPPKKNGLSQIKWFEIVLGLGDPLFASPKSTQSPLSLQVLVARPGKVVIAHPPLGNGQK